MSYEFSDLIKFTFLAFFLFFCFYLSLPQVHVFGKKIIPETIIAREIKTNKFFLRNSFSTDYRKESGIIYYENGVKVSLLCDGKIKIFHSNSKSVKDLLIHEKITLSKFDTVNYPLEKPIQDGDQVKIKRIKYIYYDFDETIPFKTVFENNILVAKGIKVVWEPGENGFLRHKIREKIEDDVLKEKIELSTHSIKEPIKEVIAYGIGEFKGPYKAKYRMYASSYNPTVEQNGPNPFGTASGMRVRFGVVAVDPKVIKLGTHLWVSGYGYAIAADTGGLIKGMRIDLFFWRRLPDENWKGWAIDVYILD